VDDCHKKEKSFAVDQPQPREDAFLRLVGEQTEKNYQLSGI